MAETKGISLGEILAFGEIRDDSEFSKRFRDFVAQDKWGIDQYKAWLDECISKGKGSTRSVQSRLLGHCGLLG